MYCRQCGQKLDFGAAFCQNCGQKVVSATGMGDAPAGMGGTPTAPPQTEARDGEKGSRKVLEFAIAGAICLFCLGCLMLYLLSGSSSDSPRKERKEEKEARATKEPASMAFDHAKYALSVKCAEDMSQYLQCANMDKKDVSWSAGSNQVQVGENGMVAIQDYNVTSTLTAKSKKDEKVLATCQVSSLSEKEDFQYKVNDYNMVRREDEQRQDGTVLVRNKNSVESKIDVYAEHIAPGKRKKTYQWKSSLFYRLEEVPDRKGGGEINDCRIARKQFINAQNGNAMEYEIYCHPRKNCINKIVSIEHMDATLEVTEYYYTNSGKVNFVFQYKTENYLPTFANPDIHGERYLYDQDTLVTWRLVKGQNKITNYCANAVEKKRLKKGGWANVKEYGKLSGTRKKKYDAVEKKMLNAAYNTYKKVEEYEGISTIRGQVCDAGDAPLSHVNVELYSDTYDSKLYTGKTNDEGYYEIFVPSRKGTYEMTYSLENQDVEEKMYHVDLDQDMLGADQEIVHMVEDRSAGNYTVRLYDATKNMEDSTGSIDNAELVFRRGINNYEGESRLSIYTDNEGYCHAALEPGMYTVEAKRGGYMQEYRNVFFGPDDEEEVPILLTPKLRKDEMRIVLTWGDRPADEDSHLFTPGQGHACYYEKDIPGANLDVDDTNGYGPETVTITDLEQGVYKYYVADYTHCSSNEVRSRELSESDATVRVYTYRGLEKTFHVPKNQKGVIWEVFSIRNGEIVPTQRYYDSIEDKEWCTRKYDTY